MVVAAAVVVVVAAAVVVVAAAAVVVVVAACPRTPHSSPRRPPGGPDKKVREPIAVDIPRTTYRAARDVRSRAAVQAKAVRAIETREIEARREGAGLGRGSLPEHHIARPGGVAVGVGADGPDDQVREPIAVDIPHTARRAAREVIGRAAVQAKAVRAIETREIEARREGAVFTVFRPNTT